MSFSKGLGITALVGIGNAILFSGAPGLLLASGPAVLFVTIYLAIRAGVSTQTIIKKVVS